MTNELTLIIPTYNEAENLAKLASALFRLSSWGPSLPLKILVVDDNSPDGTGQIAEDLGGVYPNQVFVLHRKGKLGYGAAVLAGLRWSLETGSRAIGMMDSDFSHPPEKLPELAAAIREADVAIGSRYVQGGSLDERWPVWRKVLSSFGNTYARTILGVPLRDMTGGFRVLRHTILEKMPLHQVRSNGYAFQIEMAYLAYLSGARFTEIPIHFADRRWGKSKMSLKIQIEAALRVWQIRYMYRHIARP